MNRIKAILHGFQKYKGLVVQLVGRDLKTKYRRSVLGILWSLLNPLLMMLVIATVFSQIMRNSIEHFAAYVLTGQVIFNFFSESTSNSMNSIILNAPLIRKVYIPKYIFPLSKIAFSFVNMLFSLLAVLIVLLIQGVPLSWTILAFPIPLLYITLFAMGVGLFLSAVTVFFRDIAHLWSVILQAWMYLTPIIYSVDMFSNVGFLTTIMRFNPLYYYVTYFREVVMYGNIPGLEFNLICLGIGLAAVALGTFVFYRKQDQFILYT